jgi:hypothetical protein
MPTARGAGTTGLYTSAFLEAFVPTRAAEERRQREDLLSDIAVARYVRDLQREAEEREALDALATPRPRPAPTGPLVPAGGANGPAPPGTQFLPRPAAPALAAPSPVAAGRPPSPFEAATAGLTPRGVSTLLRSNVGRAALATFTEQERERRREEDRAEAEQHFTRAAEAAKAGQPDAWADAYAAGLRRLGQHGPAGQVTEYALKYREEDKERAAADEDFRRIAECDRAYEAEPNAASYATFLGCLTSLKSRGLGPALRRQIAEHTLRRRLSADPLEDMFFRRVTRGYLEAPAGAPPDPATIWRGAMRDAPEGFARVLKGAVLNPDKQKLPAVVWEILRLPEQAGAIPKSTTELAYAEVRRTRPELSEADPRFWSSVYVRRDELLRREQAARETPTAGALRELQLQIARARAERAKNPTQATRADITRDIQRIEGVLQDKAGLLSDDEITDLQTERRALISELRRLRARPGEERARPSDEPAAPRLAPGTFDALPPARDQAGRVIQDSQTGKRYRSDGQRWIPIQ